MSLLPSSLDVIHVIPLCGLHFFAIELLILTDDPQAQTDAQCHDH
jgi:hypothetical protein